MRAVVLGAGATGARAVRQLIATPAVTAVAVADVDGERSRRVVESMADDRARSVPATGRWWDGSDVAVLAHPGGDHADLARRLVDDHLSVVSVSGAAADLRGLLALDDHARQRRRVVVAGAGFSPGLSCLLAAHGASGLDAVDEVHVARTGWGGPACREG
ncbi:MAG TPA: hypothetical protein VNT56_00520, partial [Acidimicrobiales bacterium]|nr:hypothetical protein [Acidimicrobiales bacterium]